MNIGGMKLHATPIAQMTLTVLPLYQVVTKLTLFLPFGAWFFDSQHPSFIHIINVSVEICI